MDNKVTPQKNSGMSNGIPVWVFILWGILTLVVGTLFLMSMILKPSSLPLKQLTTTSTNKGLQPQIIWKEDFQNSNLDDWTLDWTNLRETNTDSGKVLLAFRNMPADKSHPVKFTYDDIKNRFFYAKYDNLPVDFSKLYSITFDFHGKGPIELLKFGHIQLRLLSDLPNLSYSPDGSDNYHSFNLQPWSSNQLNKEIHSFKIAVQPANHTYEIQIDGNTIGHVSYSKTLSPSSTLYFQELLPSSGEPVVNAVYYDNFLVFGTPTHPIQSKADVIVSKPPPPPKYKEYYEQGWDKYNSGEWNEAIALFKQAIQEYPESAEAYNAMGLAYKASGDTTQAWQSWIKAVAIDSTFTNARRNLGMQ